MAERVEFGGNGRPTPWWAPIALSWSFLTVLPAPFVEARPGAVAVALVFFPLVGAALGALLGGLSLALDRVLPDAPIAVLVLAASALLTGGLHLDALMDTADGVFGGTTPADRLTIMRDSRIGAFGAIAGALALLGQYACLSDLSGTARLIALVVALALGRWAMVVAIRVFLPARPDGLGATFHQAASVWTLAGATVLAVLAAVVTGPLGLAALAGSAAVALLGGWFIARRIGGLTGDSYGALAVVTETLILYLAVALGR
ncbi:MAG: adenosylcobinamide-GDP ribazoletransferase [Chloroflexota bacterium]